MHQIAESSSRNFIKMHKVSKKTKLNKNNKKRINKKKFTRNSSNFHLSTTASTPEANFRRIKLNSEVPFDISDVKNDRVVRRFRKRSNKFVRRRKTIRRRRPSTGNVFDKLQLRRRTTKRSKRFRCAVNLFAYFANFRRRSINFDRRAEFRRYIQNSIVLR